MSIVGTIRPSIARRSGPVPPDESGIRCLLAGESLLFDACCAIESGENLVESRLRFEDSGFIAFNCILVTFVEERVMTTETEPQAFVDRTIYWYKKALLENYTNFEGRAGRAEFWFFVLANLIVSIGISAVLGIVSETLASLVGSVYALAVFLPGLGLSIRRLHDTDRSGWWLLIGFLPLVGWIVLIIFYAERGMDRPNQYGPPPGIDPGHPAGPGAPGVGGQARPM